ncbi:peptide/nickel transport system substrate-binding protein [Pullulanibacillus pueri]|uniref:ABC transporter substrate-binding protein n=1 Tax=Pullulanibacillus pueri TaxID=1437324 RepID=A0A8J2ZZ41_9BACL|nr:ABC transporter substrate-binding protein [Pullulanibacillus pueri]MBM7683198.1 peptide/nickel transport system substrate-binding protein [Pullulanibacillus pueri]GGH85600.1 ABC transporter substrate-binding protein [Pullulanibacillus pueri]
MKRKSYVVFSMLIISLLFVIVGCGGGDAANQDNGNNTAAGDSSANKGSSDSSSDKTIIFGRGADSVQLDPSKVTDGESIYVTNQIYDTLVRYKQENTEVQPALATDWKTSDDGKVWTFHLKKDVKFHDGTDFNADAVVYNFKRWTTSADFVYYGYMFGASKDNMKGIIQNVEATDDDTVKFTLSEPNAPFLQTLAMPPFGIASPTAVKKYGDDYFKNPVGTGPFVFDSWDKDDKIVLHKNKDYFGQVADADQVIFRVIPDNGARFMELQAGTINMMDGMNPEDMQKVKDDNNLQIVNRPSMNVGYMAMNTSKKGPMANTKVRQAINMAIDKKKLMTLYQGIGQEAKNPMPPSLWGYNDEIKDYSYNVDQAKKLLAEAGYGKGFTMNLYTMTNPRPYMPQPKLTAEAIQQMLKDVNIKVNIVENDWDTHLTKTEEGAHDAALMGWTGDNGDPDNFLYVLLDKDNAKKGSAGNIAFYKNDQVHKLLKKAQITMDQGTRTDIYKQVQEIIHDDAPWVPIAYTTPPMAISKTISGYVPHATGSEPFNYIKFK